MLESIRRVQRDARCYCRTEILSPLLRLRMSWIGINAKFPKHGAPHIAKILTSRLILRYGRGTRQLPKPNESII